MLPLAPTPVDTTETQGSVQCSQFWIRSSLSLTPLPVLLSSLFTFLSKKIEKNPPSVSCVFPFRYCFPFLFNSLPVLFPLPLQWLPLHFPSSTISPSFTVASFTFPFQYYFPFRFNPFPHSTTSPSFPFPFRFGTVPESPVWRVACYTCVAFALLSPSFTVYQCAVVSPREQAVRPQVTNRESEPRF